MAAPTVGTVTTRGQNEASTAFAHTTATGETYLVVDWVILAGGTPVDPTACTFGATSLTKVLNTVGGTFRHCRFTGVVPASTTANVTVAYTGTQSMCCAVRSLVGGGAETASVGSAFASGVTSVSASLTGVDGDTLMLDVFGYHWQAGGTPGAGQTQDWTPFQDHATLQSFKLAGSHEAGEAAPSWSAIPSWAKVVYGATGFKAGGGGGPTVEPAWLVGANVVLGGRLG